jgi:uncharacterized protein YkwD
MKNAVKQLILFFAVICLSLLCVQTVRADDSGDLSAKKPSKNDIVSMYDSYNGMSYDGKYQENPRYTGGDYYQGVANRAYLEKACSYLNYIRYVAGLPSVTLDDDANVSAQYGATLLAANNTLTHYPSKPTDMSDDFYSKGYAATTSSNIGYASWGADLLTHISGCMSDSSGSNKACLGHRRWLLNPSMSLVGFGIADKYSLTKVFNFSSSSSASVDYNFVSWPNSGNCPDNLFSASDPWSITLNPSKYQISSSADEVEVTIKRASDGASWTLNSSTNTDSSTSLGKPIFLINRDGYGVSNCIIFTPGTESLGNDALSGVYNVTLTGIKDKSGNAVTISYTVDFFNIEQYRNEGGTDLTVDYSSVFDAEYYYNNNPDVAAAIGNDAEALLNHFINYGMSEGRDSSSSFNLEAYRYYNGDVAAAFGSDNKQYYLHYMNYGQYEGRRTTGLIVGGLDYSYVFDKDYYYNNNPDVAAALGSSEKALLQHFIDYGMREGRQASAGFDVNAYRSNNADVAAAFGDNLQSYYIHYMQYGKNENRICTASETFYNGTDYAYVYNKEYYLSHNPDVAAAFSGDTAATLAHFVNYGMKEGRQACEDFNVNAYRDRYEDLQNAFGGDLQSYYLHYISYGKAEGRNAA